jgi:hypothetical protein
VVSILFAIFFTFSTYCKIWAVAIAVPPKEANLPAAKATVGAAPADATE